MPRRVETFLIHGKPVPKGSRVSGVTKSGTRFNRESNPHVGPWMKMAEKSLRSQCPVQLEPPYKIEASFYFTPPKEKSWPRTGDVDKFCRALLDALTHSGVIEDDRHVIELSAVKRYGDPRTEVTVEEVDH